jgi:hypothetical protein
VFELDREHLHLDDPGRLQLHARWIFGADNFFPTAMQAGESCNRRIGAGVHLRVFEQHLGCLSW